MPQINRRNFLKLFTAGFVFKMLDAQKLHPQSTSQFESAVLGLRFSVPAVWHSMDGITALKVLDDQILTREDFDRLPATPLMVYTRYEEPYPQMNPSVGLFVDKWHGWMGDSAADFSAAFLTHYASLLKAPRIEVPSHALTLGNHVWQQATLCFDFVGASGFEHRIRMRSYLTFLSGHLVMLNLTDSENGNEKASREFSVVESSIATFR